MSTVTSILPISNAIAPVNCYVSIYPFEGGQWHFSTDISQTKAYSGILSCTVSKNIRNPNSGTFSILLSPGGPTGVKSFPSWTEVLTPMSLTVIGMGRGTEESIVMVGFVLSVRESQRWNGNRVERVIQVDGADFSYIFTTRNYFNLAWLAGPGSILLPGSPSAGYAFALSSSALTGTPDALANTWYNKIMLQILQYLQFSGDDGRLGFGEIIGYIFQEYTSAAPFIPFNSNFISSTGSWMDKFMAFFPFPFYEYFVYTVSNTVASLSLDNLSQFSKYSTLFENVPFVRAGGHYFEQGSYVLQVGRLLPFPTLTHTASGQPSGPPNMSLWDNLIVYDLSQTSFQGFIQSNVAFLENEVSNFYVINPTQISSFLVGAGQGGPMSATLLFPFAQDAGSIFRYGWRPMIKTIEWFSWEVNKQPPKNTSAFSSLGYYLLDQLTSYYEPTPLMARGTYTNILMPNVFPGNIIRYYPFRDKVLSSNGQQRDATWDFYIEGVDHTFVFGGQSTTTLTVSRGLPTAVYQNPDLLTQILTGQAQRLNGQYKAYPPSPGSPLQYYTYAEANTALHNAGLSSFSTPTNKNSGS